MAFTKYELPTLTFPYKIKRRLNLLSHPRKYIIDTGEGMPPLSPTGVRMSALRGRANERITESSYPYIRRLLLLKREYKKKFPQKRLEFIDRKIEQSNATIYSKIANCAIDLKKQDTMRDKKKKAWTESDWKKHTDYILNISQPKPEFIPDPIERGPHKPLSELLPRIMDLSFVPEYKIYKRLSQQSCYRDPTKVAPLALKYVISERVKKLAEPKVLPPSD